MTFVKLMLRTVILLTVVDIYCILEFVQYQWFCFDPFLFLCYLMKFKEEKNAKISEGEVWWDMPIITVLGCDG